MSAWTPKHQADHDALQARPRGIKANGRDKSAAAEVPRNFDVNDPIPVAEPMNWMVALKCASDINPQPISWLWRGWLARGKMHIIAGQPGAGKTTIAIKMAATVSAGGRWPDGSAAKQANVVIWSSEDDHADTLVPRLEASGADLRRVFFAGEMSRGKERRAFDPARDIPALQAAIQAAGGAAVIVVDPIVSATAADSHKNGETRRALQPLVDLAMKFGAALIGITHFTKGSEGRSPIDRVHGSVAFGALARVVMVAAQEKAGGDGKPGKRVLMRAKSNVGKDDGGFNYELQMAPMRDHPDILASVVCWREPVTGSAREILAAAEAEPADNEGDGTALHEAKDWLVDFLREGPRTAKEVQSSGRDAGHTLRTLRRAKAALRVSSLKDGVSGGWGWRLPASKDDQGGLTPKTLASLATFVDFQGFQDGQELAAFEEDQGLGHELGVFQGGQEGQSPDSPENSQGGQDGQVEGVWTPSEIDHQARCASDETTTDNWEGEI
jgi:putative DNA primase/helicase